MAKLSAHGEEIFTARISRVVESRPLNFTVVEHLRLMSDGHILRREDYKHGADSFHDWSDGWKRYRKIKTGIENTRLENYYIERGYEVERP